MPPRVFCKKSLDLLDCKGFDFFEGAPFEAQGKKEPARVCRERSYVVGSSRGVEVKTELT
jgi:hypothetical protein